MGTGDGAKVPQGPRLRTWVMVALTITLVVIGGLRFARADVLGTSFFATDRYYTFETDEGSEVENLNIDIVQYLSMVEDHRGVPDAFEKQEPYPEFADNPDSVKGPVAPFIYRPLIPWLASLLPLAAPEALALTNLVLVVAGLWLLVDALHRSGRSPRAQLFGGILYTVALPVLVFTSSLYIDGGAMAFMVLGYWLVVRRYWLALVAFIPLSYLAKEALIALAPAAAWAWRLAGHRFRSVQFALGAGAAALGWVAVSVLVRSGAPEPVLSYNIWPKLSYLGGNLGQPLSTAFFIIGLAPVVLPGLWLLWTEARRHGARELVTGRCGFDLVGLLTMAGMNLYSLVSTDLTLRTGWLVFPFAISLSAMWFDDRFDDANTPAWTRSLGTPNAV